MFRTSSFSYSIQCSFGSTFSTYYCLNSWTLGPPGAIPPFPIEDEDDDEYEDE
jgi:hypothetical protein